MAPSTMRVHLHARNTVRVALCFAAIAGASRTLAAQRVTGHVTESSSRSAIPGAVVTLLDSAGRPMARTITDATGQYHLTGSGHAARITAIRIGFHPGAASVAALAADSSATVDVSLDVLPQLLGTVAVHDQALCPQASSAPAAFALWDQARTALLASIVARDVDAPEVRSVLFTRDLSANGRHIDKQTVTDSIYVASRPVVAMRTAQEFAVKGYRIRSATTDVFLGPDADVLLDLAFLRGHCLSLAGKADATTPEVGIAFEPTPHQDSIVDIAGVLWLSRTVPALDSLTFHFTNLTRVETEAGAGGELLFTTMPNGVPMITRWTLHVPETRTQAVEIRGLGALPASVERLVGFRDTGGALAEASWSDATSWIGQLPMIRGTVVAAGDGAVIPGAAVQLAGTNIATQTDSMGAFVLPMTVPGPYVIEAQGNLMAQVGIAWRSSTSIDLAPSGANVQLELPTHVGKIDLSNGPTLLHVFDQATGARVRGAAVRDTLGDQLTTSSTGAVALNGLRTMAGYYMLEIRKAGYAPQHAKLRANSATNFRIDLQPNVLGSATTLPTVVTTEAKTLMADPGLREGFATRCQMKNVECVGRRVLDLEPTGQLAQWLSYTPGVYNRCGVAPPSSFIAKSVKTCGLQMIPTVGPGDFCTPTFFLNGYEWNPLAANAQDELDQYLYAGGIEGIEVYLSGAPHPNRFMVDPESHCGLVVIWTT